MGPRGEGNVGRKKPWKKRRTKDLKVNPGNWRERKGIVRRDRTLGVDFDGMLREDRQAKIEAKYEIEAWWEISGNDNWKRKLEEVERK